jgi:hypothetical protein
LQDEEFAPSWFFNLDPVLNAEFLEFKFISGSGLPVEQITSKNDSQNAAGNLGKGFDIEFSWSTSQGRRFIADKFLIYRVTYHVQRSRKSGRHHPGFFI